MFWEHSCAKFRRYARKRSSSLNFTDRDLIQFKIWLRNSKKPSLNCMPEKIACRQVWKNTLDCPRADPRIELCYPSRRTPAWSWNLHVLDRARRGSNDPTTAPLLNRSARMSALSSWWARQTQNLGTLAATRESRTFFGRTLASVLGVVFGREKWDTHHPLFRGFRFRNCMRLGPNNRGNAPDWGITDDLCQVKSLPFTKVRSWPHTLGAQPFTTTRASKNMLNATHPPS